MVHHPQSAPEYEFGMIDLHRMRTRTQGNQQAAMNLGRFFYSLPAGFMDEELQQCFFKQLSGIRFCREPGHVCESGESVGVQNIKKAREKDRIAILKFPVKRPIPNTPGPLIA